ncbi:Kinesin-like protein KIN-7H [Sesamum alatum]|uniref:Kinesin-like protein KIN-7H n=1 Tax=Sesamum alatum TaxID=300844 RepID=A0AAE2CCR1_9LAMI|nr:Kinesin-like protein KIN-7H [Sesamum alatum]
MESGEELMGGNEERIHVSVRLRPLNSKEILRNDVSDWECINDDTVVYKNVNLSASDRSMYPTAYTFDRVFRSDCSTREVYEKGAKDVAVSVLSGLNSSVFAYGQTSSGKTYTMTGVTEYAIADIYEYVQKHPERQFVLKFSAMEIYNESVRDLLSVDSTPLRLLDDPERGTIVEKLTEEILRDWDHVVQLLSVCEAQRQIGETSLNEMSSRSHQIIRLTIESTSRDFLGRENASTLSAAVNFVDLAGSERASQSLSAGTRLKEGCHINRSLLTLGTIIRKLSKGRGGHIPYRDSKLTRILQTSLGGNARTAIICTMSPARSHVEQSRNTLHFASCAKEVATNAQVNVVMSDKALVKYLQRELERLESELRSPQSALPPSDYSAILREKDLQIEKLEEEISDLILQRDIAQSQVKDLLQMLGDGASSMTQVGLGHYPHLRVQKLPDSEAQERETSILADPHSLDVDTRRYSDGHSTTSSQDQIVRVPYFVEDFVQSNASPRVLISSSNFSGSYSYHGWEEIEKQSNGNSEDLCREVRCIETEELSNNGAIESNCVFPEENNSEFPEVKVYVKENMQTTESPSTPPETDQGFKSSPLKNDSEMKDDTGTGVVTSKEDQELIPVPLEEVKESLPPLCEKEKALSSIHYLDTPALENLSLRHELDQDSSVVRRLKLTKSRSCKASIANSASPRFKIKDFGENTSSFGSERESVCFERKLSPLSFSPEVQSLSRNASPSSPGNALDIEIDTPNVKFATAEDVTGSTTEMTEKAKLPTEHVFITDPSKEIDPKGDETPKKNVKDVGLDPIGDEFEGLPSWPVEFKRLQQEIIELWHACNVSLVHRTYFFMLFRGDPSDAIYLEVELRRMKFLKDKFSRGEKTIVNGRRLTLASSEKALCNERRMLSKRMMSKFSEQERENLFLKWGIGLNTKLRRQQLAQRLWSKTEDMDHISDSAFLVAKLVGFIEPGKAPNKEMFGLNFTPRRSSRTYSFKRSLVSLL